MAIGRPTSYGGWVMSRFSNEYVDLPEGLPPEHADAYRAGYERARRAEEPTVRVERQTDPGPGDEPTQVLDAGAVAAAPKAQQPTARAARGRRKSDPDRPGRRRSDPDRSSRRRQDADRVSHRKVLLVALVSLLLVAVAFVVGRVVADAGAPGDGTAADSAQAGGQAGAQAGGAERAAYDGPVESVQVSGASASCQAGDSVDEAGNPVSYPPSNAVDADLSTAWRCAGPGTGETLTLELPGETRVAEVGLVPGYAKSDPASGVDRYAENNRITRVRWSFEDGSSVVQRIDPDPQDRSMRTVRVTATTTGAVTLEVLASDPGARDTIAVSEVRVAAAD